MEYLNFDIRILPGQPYTVYAEQMQVGEAEGVLDLNPDDPDVREALMRLASRQTDQGHLAEFGNFLFQKLFADEVGARFEQATGFSFAQKEQGLRIRLRIDTPELASLPWELLFTPARSFLGSNQKSPVIRWLYVPHPIKNLLTPLPLRILVVIPTIGAPYPPLEVEKEVSILKNALAGMKKEVEIIFLDKQVSLDQIGHTLVEQSFQVIHFIGHAEFSENQGRLLLNDSNGGMEWIDEIRFAEMVKNHDDLKLIFLNACQGATVSQTQVLTGIAPKLVKAGVPAVVAMQYPIYDNAAILFAQEFYYALFKGPNAGRIDWAMAHARNTLMRDFPDEREIAAPVLFLRAPEGVLFYKVTGKRFRDAAFSKASVDTERAIEKTYQFNTSFADTGDASHDNNLLKYFEKDGRDYDYLKKRISFRNRIVLASVATFVVVFMFFWVGLLDILRLDTLLEGATLAVANSMTNQIPSDDIVIVGIDKAVDVSWRDKHAVVVERLSKAKAKVVVFDMTFEPSEDPTILAKTRVFANSIAAAHLRGTKVVLGFRNLDEAVPVIEDTLRDVLRPQNSNADIADTAGLGAICLSGKLGVFGTVPNLTKKSASISEKKPPFPSLALAAFFAFKGVKGYHIPDNQENSIYLEPLELGSIPFSERRSAYGSNCEVIDKGDVTADLIINLTPAELIRDVSNTILYDDVFSGDFEATKPDFFSGKVVFVGEKSKRETFSVFDLANKERFGVELHADAFTSIQRGNLGSSIIHPLKYGYQCLMIITMAFTGGFLRFWFKRPSIRLRIALLFGIPIVYSGIAFWFCVSQHLLVDWLYHLASFFFAYFITGRVERRWF